MAATEAANSRTLSALHSNFNHTAQAQLNQGSYFRLSQRWPPIHPPFAALGDGDKASEPFRMVKLINRTATGAILQTCTTESYAVATGGVQSSPQHVGWGGWTWPTSFAGWVYREGVEWILGFRLRGTSFSIDLCVARSQPLYFGSLGYRLSQYQFELENPAGSRAGISRLNGAAYPSRTSPISGASSSGMGEGIRYPPALR
jgi:cellobiose phosphorylase